MSRSKACALAGAIGLLAAGLLASTVAAGLLPYEDDVDAMVLAAVGSASKTVELAVEGAAAVADDATGLAARTVEGVPPASADALAGAEAQVGDGVAAARGAVAAVTGAATGALGEATGASDGVHRAVAESVRAVHGFQERRVDGLQDFELRTLPAAAEAVARVVDSFPGPDYIPGAGFLVGVESRIEQLVTTLPPPEELAAYAQGVADETLAYPGSAVPFVGGFAGDAANGAVAYLAESVADAQATGEHVVGAFTPP